jgi:superfamily II DNA/RNA helicase
MMGLNAKTEDQVTSKKNTITPRLRYVSDDSDRRSMLIELIQSSASDKGNTIIYVNDEQRLNHLAEFLLDHNLGEFSGLSGTSGLSGN